jgi:hypothetical protein
MPKPPAPPPKQRQVRPRNPGVLRRQLQGLHGGPQGDGRAGRNQDDTEASGARGAAAAARDARGRGDAAAAGARGFGVLSVVVPGTWSHLNGHHAVCLPRVGLPVTHHSVTRSPRVTTHVTAHVTRQGHPHAVRLWDVYEDAKAYHLVMENLAGESPGFDRSKALTGPLLQLPLPPAGPSPFHDACAPC